MNSYPILVATCQTAPGASHSTLHQAAYRLLYEQTANYLNETISEIKASTIVHNEYGKPYFRNLPVAFNLSHTKGMCACILATGEPGWEVGIDIEALRPYKENVAKRIFSQAENDYVQQSCSKEEAFTKLWTLKEAYVKAIGKGLSFPLDKAAFQIGNNDEIVFYDPDCCFTQKTLVTPQGTFFLSTAAVPPKHLSHI